MSVVVFDTRTVLADGDTLSTWVGGALNTVDFAEATGSISAANNIGTLQIYFGTTLDLTGTLVYFWSANNATQNSWITGANSSHALWLSDNTNSIAFFQAGNDRDVFKHADNQVLFQCFTLDPDYATIKDTAGETFASAGSFANLNFAALTQVGGYYVTLSKALAGGSNNFADVIRYGNDGIVVHGGSSVDPGTILEVVVEDRSTVSGRALGIIREYTAGAYGCQGTLQFGITGGSPVTGGSPAYTWFEDSNISITYEDRDIGDDKLRFQVNGSSIAGQETHFILSNSTISSARPAVTVDMSGDGIDELFLTSVTFTGLKNPMFFPTDTSVAGSPQGLLGNHLIITGTFNDCGMIDPGTTQFNNNTISNSTTFSVIGSPSGTLAGALLIDVDGTGNLSNLAFSNTDTVGSPIIGHAVYVAATGSYTFDTFTYSGYASIDGSTGTEAVFNDSGGAVTITISGGDIPSVRNGVGATTVVIAGAVTTLFHIQDSTGLSIENARVHVRASDGTGPQPFEESVTIISAGSPVVATVSHATHGLSSGNKVLISGASPQEYNGVHTITLTGGSPLGGYTYPVFNSSPQTPTGTITSTGVIIDGLTDVSGNISDTRTFASNQPIEGNVRKSTIAPYYKSSNIINTINNTGGLSSTITMILDQ